MVDIFEKSSRTRAEVGSMNSLVKLT